MWFKFIYIYEANVIIFILLTLILISVASIFKRKDFFDQKMFLTKSILIASLFSLQVSIEHGVICAVFLMMLALLSYSIRPRSKYHYIKINHVKNFLGMIAVCLLVGTFFLVLEPTLDILSKKESVQILSDDPKNIIILALTFLNLVFFYSKRVRKNCEN